MCKCSRTQIIFFSYKEFIFAGSLRAYMPLLYAESTIFVHIITYLTAHGCLACTGTKVMFPVSGNVQYRAKFPIQFPSHQEILPYTVQFLLVVLTCPFTFPVQGSSGNAIFLPVMPQGVCLVYSIFIKLFFQSVCLDTVTVIRLSYREKLIRENYVITS